MSHSSDSVNGGGGEIPCDLEAAKRHLQLIDPTASIFIFCLFDDRKKSDPKLPPIKLVGTLDEHWPEIQARQADGYGVFVTVNKMFGQDRSNRNVKCIRAVWRDRDAPAQKLPLTPTMRVQTSHDKDHEYFIVDPKDPLTRSEAKAINVTIAKNYGGDSCATDSARVLRLAGTWNLKQEPFLVAIVEASGKLYSRQELLRAFPIATHLETRPKIPLSNRSGPKLGLDRYHIPLSYIDPDDYKDWIEVGMALHYESEGGAEGKNLWETWSRRSAKFVPGECDAKWETFRDDEGRITGGKIFYLARLAGMKPNTIGSEVGSLFSTNSGDTMEPPFAEPQPLIEFADYDGTTANPNDDAYLIKRIMHRQSIGSLVGPSGVGKSTVALDLAFAIAHGVKMYHGRRVKRAPVLYVGYEGVSGFRNRVAAAVQRFGSPGHWFARILTPPLLCRSEQGEAGVKKVIEAVRELEAAADHTIGLVVIDTKSRATAGDDEDKASDASFYIEHRVARIVHETGAAVLTVHHTGKDQSRGARGSSAIFAADDFHLMINRSKTVRIDKARDSNDDISWFSYEFDVIKLRTDSDGDPVTACVINAHDNVRGRDNAKKKVAGQKRVALDILKELYDKKKTRLISGTSIGLEDKAGDIEVVLADDWRQACLERGITKDPTKKDSERTAWRRCHQGLLELNEIGSNEDLVWVPERL